MRWVNGNIGNLIPLYRPCTKITFFLQKSAFDVFAIFGSLFPLYKNHNFFQKFAVDVFCDIFVSIPYVQKIRSFQKCACDFLGLQDLVIKILK